MQSSIIATVILIAELKFLKVIKEVIDLILEHKVCYKTFAKVDSIPNTYYN